MARQINVGDNRSPDEGRYKLCPVGTWPARIMSAEYKKIDSSGKELNEVKFVGLAGPAEGCEVKEAFWLTSDKTYERYDLFCEALGISKGTTVDPNDPWSSLVGRTIVIKVKHEDREHEGKTYTDAKLAAFIGWTPADKEKYPDQPAGEKGGHANPDPTGGGQADDSDEILPF